MQLGPIAFRPTIALRDVGKDSNVFLSRFNPISAWTATLIPMVDASMHFGNRGFITARVGPEFVWYSPVSVELQDRDGTTHHASQDLSHTNLISAIKGNLALRDLRFFASADYQRHEERPNNEIDQRAERTNLLQRGGVGYEYSPKTALDAIVSRERITYEDPDFRFTVACPDNDGDGTSDPCVYTIDDLLSRIERSITLRFSQRVLGRTRLIFDAQEKLYKFLADTPPPDVNGVPPLVGPYRDSSETRLMAGFELDEGGRIWGGLRAGTIDFQPERGPGRSQATTEPTWSGSLNWRLFRRFAFTTAVDRDLYFSTFSDNLYFRQDHAGLHCVYYLNRIVGVEVGYDGYRLVYPTATSFFIGPFTFTERRRDEIDVYRGGFRFKLANRTVATVRLSSRARTSNIPGSEDNQLLFTTGVETIF
jgi:hypothetical protein